MEEIWKDIVGYEGLYQASNLGNIKSITHIRKNGKNENRLCTTKGKMLKPGIDSNGYMLVVLSKKGKTKSYRVHRLIALTFIKNNAKCKCINHKDENKLNNQVDNLEWCTHRYNNNYGTKGKRISQKNSIKVNQYDLKGNFIKQWNSMTEAEKKLNIKRAATNICACCKNKVKSAYGYKWEYGE